ncbi:MAG: translation initiation factor IF-6 [Candidatus Aenigmarchaeota archaeon]|nr:translation initiation factor IF-6 [Candidatus Aenigmarchaeota archaeon]
MPFKFSKAKLKGDPNIGLYGFATESYCLLGTAPQPSMLKTMKKVIGVKPLVTSLSGTELLGIFAAGNSNGILVPKIVEEQEIKEIKKLGLNVEVINSKRTALGNLVLCNDKGCVISRGLSRFKDKIEDALGVEISIGTVAGLSIVGSCAAASNTGCLCHRETKEKEMKLIESILKVKVDIGTVGYGSPYINSGIIVNSKGILYSDTTTGAELGRIEEVFVDE